MASNCNSIKVGPGLLRGTPPYGQDDGDRIDIRQGDDSANLSDFHQGPDAVLLRLYAR